MGLPLCQVGSHLSVGKEADAEDRRVCVRARACACAHVCAHSLCTGCLQSVSWAGVGGGVARCPQHLPHWTISWEQELRPVPGGTVGWFCFPRSSTRQAEVGVRAVRNSCVLSAGHVSSLSF